MSDAPTPKDPLYDAALEYHRVPTPGKISIKPTTALATQRDLALAYSPGVAAPCLEIEKDPLKALDYTSRGNMVAVISNGTAVLGLGDIGALASKPVMEGKAVLFKKFADIDAIDLEIDEKDVDKFVEIVAPLEASWGGINLEDIKAPECFEIERKLKERMKIPVFHDDQHGTAIIVAAAFLNWLHLKDIKITDVKLVANGAGAASLACLNLLTQLGLPKDNITVCDRKGVIYKNRKEYMDPYKSAYAVETNARSLSDALEGANFFLGLSAAGTVTAEMVVKMADAPLIMALANPTPEIMPEEALKAKPDAIVCTGRSDFTNQVNNALCFPFLFRGALDVGATAINEDMKIACVKAIAALARKEVTSEVAAVYSSEHLEFGPHYLIPKPFDPRLIVELPMAVARAAMESGVAARPIKDWQQYKERLESFNVKTHLVMRPVFDKSLSAPKRIVYCEGEEERVLRAVQMVIDEGVAKPILIGRKDVVETRIKRLRLRLKVGTDFELVDPQDDPRYRQYSVNYHHLMERRGVTPAMARTLIRTNTTAIGAMMIHMDEVDAMICGTEGKFWDHFSFVRDIIGLRPGVDTAAAMCGLVHPKGTFFITDTHVQPDPSFAQIADITIMAAEEVKRFGIDPKIALLSHSNFGSHDTPSAHKMRLAYKEVRRRAPTLEIDGEMHADSALSETIRKVIMPHANLSGMANILVCPNLDAGSIAYNIIKTLGDAIPIGPILLGIERPVHILTPSVTSRGIFNVSALASVQAQVYEHQGENSEAS